MAKGDAIYFPDVQSDIDMKNTYKLLNWNQGSTSVLSIANTIYVDATNGTSSGSRGTTAAFQTLNQALAVAQAGDTIQIRPGTYTPTTGHTISVAGLTIIADGVKFNYNSGTGAGSISVQADRCKIYGLEIDGGINTGTTNNGVIEITGDYCHIDRCYIHNSDRIGIRPLGHFNGLRITGCRLEYNNTGILTSISADVTGILVKDCLIQNNRNTGLAISNVNPFQLKKITVVNNRLVNNQAGADCEALLLFGGTQDFIVSNNYVSGNAFAISINTSRMGVCNGNVLKGGTYCGIELAGCKNVVCDGNYIDGRNDSDTAVGQNGIVVSGSYSTSHDAGPFVLSNNLFTNLNSGPALNISGANDIIISGNYSRDNTTNFGGILINECFRTRIIGNALVTTCDTIFGPVTLDAGARTVGGKGLQDIEVINNVFDNTGGSYIVGITDSQVKGVNRVKVVGNIVPQGGTYASGYLNDAASTTGLVQEKNIPQSAAPNNQTGWHNSQSIENISIPGLGSFSTTSPGVTLEPTGRTRIAFDGDNGGIRYNIYDNGATRPHVFSCGAPGATTDLFSIFGNGVAKVGSNVVETQNNKGQISGYASLDGTGKVPAAQLPTLSSGTIAVTSDNLKGDGAGNAVAVTATGTGDTVLATSPTLITPTIGVATATSVNKWTLTAPSTAATLTAGADGLTYTMPEISTKVGFRHIPQNSQSASYTTVLNDSGKHIYHPAADANNRTFTIDSNANVAYPIGTAIMFVNLSANNLSIAITADTMYLAGTGTTGTRTLAQYGKATAVKTGTTEWVIAGVGLS